MSLRDGADILALGELDQKLWVALAMPTRDLDIDPETLDALDDDRDHRIRVRDILQAVEWIKGAFKDPGQLLTSSDKVELAQIAAPKLLSAAKRVLTDLGKVDATAITIGDVAAISKTYADTVLNGDGVVIAESTHDEELRKVIADVIATHGSVLDRSGKPGVNRDKATAFFAEIDLHAQWMGQPASSAELRPLDDTPAAAAAFKAVIGKLEDYFARTRLAAYDARAVASLASQEADFQAMAGQQLSLTAQDISRLPLAKIDPAGTLSLSSGLNPAWADRMAAFQSLVVRPLLGEKASITADDLAKLTAKLTPHCDWLSRQPTTRVSSLADDWVQRLAGVELRGKLDDLIAADAALADDYAERSSVEKLVRFQRDFGRILRNFVNFSDFYSRQDAVFQAGTLYFDARAARLCVWVADEGKHAALASSSGTFLVYCTVTRAGTSRHLACALTNGDGDNVFVGRNGIFYDRDGNDWDATVTKIVSNPISVREAFWSPYKKLIRTIEEQVTKRAQAAEANADAKLVATGTAIANVDPTKPADPAAPGAPAAAPILAAPVLAPMRKIDIGTVAAIGVAIGGIGTMMAGVFGMIFGLGKWLPVGFVAVILAVSGPSMAIAWLKLRKRNLGPILDANNWAVNGSARINVAFGAAMTSVAELPKGAQRSMSDPFADKPSRWRRWVLLAVVVLLGGGWYFGKLDAYLPEGIRSTTVVPWRKPGDEAAAVKAKAEAAAVKAKAEAAAVKAKAEAQAKAEKKPAPEMAPAAAPPEPVAGPAAQ